MNKRIHNGQWTMVDAVNNILWRKMGRLCPQAKRNKLNRKVGYANVCVFELVSSLCALKLSLSLSLALSLFISWIQWWSLCKCFVWTVQQQQQQQQKPNNTDVVKFIALSRCHPSKILHLSPANKHTKRWIEHIWALSIFHCWTTTPTTASTATMATTRWESLRMCAGAIEWASERARVSA